MHIKNVTIEGFKRFTKLIIRDLPATARLVVLTGPNGSGKSSLFDSFLTWYGHHREWGGFDAAYHTKTGCTLRSWSDSVRLEFDAPIPNQPDQRKKLFYFRSAYRHEPEFLVESFNRQPSQLDDNQHVKRMIQQDIHVSANYRRIVATTVAEVFGGKHDNLNVGDLRERLIGQIRTSMQHVFDGLLLSGTGNPLEDGSFYFDKGASQNFHYRNLSGGEKAAFDLLLDFVVKREVYDDTVYCIDEPELHMHTRTQGLLLQEMFELLPERSQLWISTHSIGMMRRACQLAEAKPDQVVFLNFNAPSYDVEVEMKPTKPNRQFWKSMLSIALDDLAGLVAPSQVVLCEGEPKVTGSDPKKRKGRAEFDAACLRQIFSPHMPDTDFLAVGNASDVRTDRLGAGGVIQTLVEGTKTIRLIDRDDCSAAEVKEHLAAGVRVLSMRHLEGYLYDDEILTRLGESRGMADKVPELLAAKTTALAESGKRGNPPDDVKSASGPIYDEVKRILGMTQCGNNSDAFCRDTLASLIVPGTSVYHRLSADIFG